MNNINAPQTIGLLGGGPAALFIFQQLVASAAEPLHIVIFERKGQLGAGMPYSSEGASPEHVTNVSDNEIPELAETIAHWVGHAPLELKGQYQVNEENFNEYKVLPRLLFGHYLEHQFARRIREAREKGFRVEVHTKTEVTDVADQPGEGKVVVTAGEANFAFDAVVVCTGHHWPKTHEGKVDGWFDSPYPPAKLRGPFNHAIALRGASLTAIDALRSLARQHGHFVHEENGFYRYETDPAFPHFRMVMHSNNGFLPAMRFHLDDTQLGKGTMLSAEDIQTLKDAHQGFVPLDFLFERHYKAPLRETDPELYAEIKDLRLEEFVEKMMALREKLDAFTLLKAEYKEAAKSIRRQQSVPWKERLGVLSYALNYPAKHMSAEDMLRLKKVLMPLISVIIAYIPQSSARELLALHEAGVLHMQLVNKESRVEPGEGGGCVYHFQDENGQDRSVAYPVYINAVGQPPMQVKDYPFPSLVSQKVVSQAYLAFASPAEAERLLAEGNPDVRRDQSGAYWLCVPGIAINDRFQVLNEVGAACPRIFNMAVPYMGGLNPDYSGLDFCEAAAKRVVAGMGLVAAGQAEAAAA